MSREGFAGCNRGRAAVTPATNKNRKISLFGDWKRLKEFIQLQGLERKVSSLAFWIEAGLPGDTVFIRVTLKARS
jgi:hypothetical protein